MAELGRSLDNSRSPVDRPILAALRRAVPQPVQDFAETMTGPDNPPVHLVLEALRRGDPMNAMGMGAAMTGPVKASSAIKGSGKAKTAPAIRPHLVDYSEGDGWITVRAGTGKDDMRGIFSAPLEGDLNRRMGLSPDDVRRQAMEQALHERLRAVRDHEAAAGRVGPLNFRDMGFPSPTDPEFMAKAQRALAEGPNIGHAERMMAAPIPKLPGK